MAENQQNRDNYFIKPGGKSGFVLHQSSNAGSSCQVPPQAFPVLALLCSETGQYGVEKITLLHKLSGWNRAQALRFLHLTSKSSDKSMVNGGVKLRGTSGFLKSHSNRYEKVSIKQRESNKMHTTSKLVSRCWFSFLGVKQ